MSEGVNSNWQLRVEYPFFPGILAGAVEMWFWPLHIHLLLFMMLSLAFTGCATIRVDVIPGSITRIEAGDCIAVVLDFEGGSPARAEKLEKSIGGCISDAMVERKLSIRFIDPNEFRRAVFPGMDITSAPRTRESLVGPLTSPKFRDKIKSLDLRYLITVREGTWSSTQVETDRQIYVIRIHGKTTELVASIIDLQNVADSGEVRVTVKDSGYYGCISCLPVVVPAFTESRACKTLGREVTKFLLEEKNGELSK